MHSGAIVVLLLLLLVVIPASQRRRRDQAAYRKAVEKFEPGYQPSSTTDNPKEPPRNP